MSLEPGPVLRELLGPVEPPVLELLERQVSVRRYPPGFAVFHEGMAPRELVLLTRGRLRLNKLRPDKRQETIANVNPVAMIGLAAAAGRIPYPATAMALEPSECLLIPAHLLEPGQDPVRRSLAIELSKACLRGMNAQLRAANARLFGLVGDRELVEALSLDLGTWSLPLQP